MGREIENRMGPHNLVKCSTRNLYFTSVIILVLILGNITIVNSAENEVEALPTSLSLTFTGNGNDDGYQVELDDNNNIILVGSTTSSDWPVTDSYMTQNPSQASSKRSGFIMKLSPKGEIIANTYLGGSGIDTIRGIGISKNGNIVVAGDTLSSDFPTTENAYSRTYSGGQINAFVQFNFCCGDAFISVLSSDLSELLYSTYIGSADADGGTISLTLDSEDNPIIVGKTNSENFPTTDDAFQKEYGGGEMDIFISRFSPDLSTLSYSTYFGGSKNDDVINGLHVDPMDNIYLAGITGSDDFPTTIDAHNTTISGGNDAFIAKFSESGSKLEYSSYLGGSDNDYGWSIVVDVFDNIHMLGTTRSTDFPITNNAFQSVNNGGNCLYNVYFMCGDLFISSFNSNFELISSSYYGGTGADVGIPIDADAEGNIYILTTTDSRDFPLKNAFDNAYGGQNHMALIKISADFEVEYSTYIGGNGVDFGNGINVGNIDEVYITGYTYSSDYPTTADSKVKGQTLFLTKFEIELLSNDKESNGGSFISYPTGATSTPSSSPNLFSTPTSDDDSENGFLLIDPILLFSSVLILGVLNRYFRRKRLVG